MVAPSAACMHAVGRCAARRPTRGPSRCDPDPWVVCVLQVEHAGREYTEEELAALNGDA